MFLFFSCLLTLCSIAYIVRTGLTNDLVDNSIILVLGSKVNRDGNPSERLKKRLDESIHIYNNCQVKKIVVSGSTGKEGFDEAIVMQNYLISRGIPDTIIETDSNGYNTLSSTKYIRSSYPKDSIVIVSQYFHLARSKYLLNKLGQKNVFINSPSYYTWRDP